MPLSLDITVNFSELPGYMQSKQISKSRDPTILRHITKRLPSIDHPL